MKLYFKSCLSIILFALASNVYAFEQVPTEKVDKTQVTDQLLEQNRTYSESYFFEFRGKQFIGFPNVFSPIVFPSSPAIKEIPFSYGASLLEIGPGTGIFSIKAALSGASHVVAIDLNPAAVANTQANAVLHGVSDRVTALVGDLFSPLGEDDKFDVIFWSIPFCHRPDPGHKMDYLELSVFDPEHEFMRRYLEGAGQHLNSGGKLIMTYSRTHGDLNFMYLFADKYSWNVNKIQEEQNDFISVELYEFTPKSPKSELK